MRDDSLALACRRRGLDGSYGRNFDGLPADVVEPLNEAFVRSLERHDLDRALAGAVAGLLRESAEAEELAQNLERPLRELASRS
jgi:hypothetical protein